MTGGRKQNENEIAQFVTELRKETNSELKEINAQYELDLEKGIHIEKAEQNKENAENEVLAKIKNEISKFTAGKKPTDLRDLYAEMRMNFPIKDCDGMVKDIARAQIKEHAKAHRTIESKEIGGPEEWQALVTLAKTTSTGKQRSWISEKLGDYRHVAADIATVNKASIAQTKGGKLDNDDTRKPGKR